MGIFLYQKHTLVSLLTPREESTTLKAKPSFPRAQRHLIQPKPAVWSMVNSARCEDLLFAFHPKLYKCNWPDNIIIRQSGPEKMSHTHVCMTSILNELVAGITWVLAIFKNDLISGFLTHAFVTSHRGTQVWVISAHRKLSLQPKGSRDQLCSIASFAASRLPQEAGLRGMSCWSFLQAPFSVTYIGRSSCTVLLGEYHRLRRAASWKAKWKTCLEK